MVIAADTTAAAEGMAGKVMAAVMEIMDTTATEAIAAPLTDTTAMEPGTDMALDTEAMEQTKGMEIMARAMDTEIMAKGMETMAIIMAEAENMEITDISNTATAAITAKIMADILENRTVTAAITGKTIRAMEITDMATMARATSKDTGN